MCLVICCTHRKKHTRYRSALRGSRTAFHFSLPPPKKSQRQSFIAGHVVHKNRRLTQPATINLAQAIGRMFSDQQFLPHMPVPSLNKTIDKYLHAVEPIFPDEDYMRIEQLLRDLSRPGCDGEKLQNLLETKAKSCDNWLEEWWLNTAYLEYRPPTTIHVSPGIILPEQKFSNREEWLRYTAKMVAGILDYKVMIDRQTLPVEQLRGKPLCMKQYYTILSSCRIPGRRRDTLIHHRPDSPKHPKHIVVAHNNYFYVMHVYDHEDYPLSIEQIYSHLNGIIESSHKKGDPIGILTTDHRDNWAKIYEHFIKDKRTRLSIDSIQNSIFLLCLDGPIFTADSNDHPSMIAGNMNHGLGIDYNSGNRWADKTLQFIVSSDGAVGLNYEHSSAEGPPFISIVDHVLDFISKNPNMGVSTASATKPEKLHFRLSQKAEESIDNAAMGLESTIHDLDMVAFKFEEFGKEFLKSQSVSPDAFIQVSLQLAYFKLYGKNTAAYESGSLRRFQGGRTGVIRSCSILTDKYCKESTAFDRDDVSCGRTLRDAIKAHSEYTTQVIDGQGVDRHLLGLKLMAIESGLNVPPFFTDPLFAESVHWRISSSQVPSKHNVTLTFAPVVPDGYGVCYNPMPNRINFSISSWNSSPETVSANLKAVLMESLLEGQRLLITTQKSKL